MTAQAGHCLVVRLDNAGDVLLAGPAVRAAAAGSRRVTMLAGPNGAAAARLLPGVDEVLVWRCPWIDGAPEPVDPADVDRLVETLAGQRFDRALVLTSFHQSPLPTALLLRLAGVPWVGAVSEVSSRCLPSSASSGSSTGYSPVKQALHRLSEA